MADFETIAPAQVDAKSPINQLLMYGNASLSKGGVKFNFDALSDRVIALEAGGGGGGGGASDTGAIGKIILGGETNEPIYWKRRFHPLQHMLNADSKNPSGFDPEGKSLKNELLQFIQSNDAGLSISADNNTYLGQLLVVAKGSSISFKIKKGVNFFNLGTTNTIASADNITVLIDGQTPSSLGLIDENGNAAPNTYSINSATILYQSSKFFYGLNSESHTVQIINNDSASKVLEFDFIEVGFRSENPTIDESIHINAGKASIRGASTAFPDSEFSFGKTELNGHTGAIVCDTAGVLTKLDGESPAMTQAKPEEAVTFSSPVTQLKVKNNFYFPANGICLLSTPYGNHHLFSYTGKTDTAIQSHSLDALIWQSQPTEDFTPLAGFGSTSVGTATGDLNINYWGTAPILIDSTNNKLDFKITIAGVTTTHAATVANGRYAADLVPIEEAVRSAMQTAKAIHGEYHLKYNDTSQLWNIYIEDEEVENFELLFSSGVNVANSAHTTLGFSGTDLTGSGSYLATTEKQHLCCKVLEKDVSYMHVEDPRIKYSATQTLGSESNLRDISDKLNLPYRHMTGGVMVQIFPDDDCCALELNFIVDDQAAMMTVQIDDGQALYLPQLDRIHALSTTVRGSIVSCIVSFPKGSRKITIRNETDVEFSIGADATNRLIFAGARQYFNRPSYEKLTLSQAIIKTLEVSPINLYATMYGHNGGVLYSPAAQDDNVNTVAETGSWAGSSWFGFNFNDRETSTINDYVDFNITLIGNGGGFFLRTMNRSTDGTRKCAMFVSQAAINETTDRVSNFHSKWVSDVNDQDGIYLLGLPSGTYNIRLKNEFAGRFVCQGFGVVDTVEPQENANTISDINNTGQSISFPINVKREVIQQDSSKIVPAWLTRSGYKEGNVGHVNYSLNSPIFVNHDDIAALKNADADAYYAYMSEGILNAAVSISGFFKSVVLKTGNLSGHDALSQAFINGVQTLNTFSLAVQVKGGAAPTSTAESFTNLNQKLFKLSCTHNAGLVFNISDTRGLKNNAVVILDDGANKEKAVLGSFVVGVSYTIKKALTTVIAANVVNIEFQGFHNYKIVTGSASIFVANCFEYEPLKISPSKALQRSALEFEYEKVSITHDYINNDDLYYPVHSDGVVGNWATSTIEKIKGDGLLYDFPQDLKNVQGAGAVKITSERVVPVINEQERF